MSIPRLAIHRPVTMFMISFVVILLGAISLTRLPVDLMPESEFPSITVRVELRRASGRSKWRSWSRGRIEQAVSAIAGLEQVNSTSQRRHRACAAAVRLGHRPQRSRRRGADARRSRPRPHARGCGSADGLQVRLELDADHGHRRRGRLRPGDAARARAERPVAAARARRRRGASVTIDGGLRRQIRVDLSSEKITAMQLCGRSHHAGAAHREPEHPARRNRRRGSAVPAAQPRPVHQHRRHPEPDDHDARRTCPCTSRTSPTCATAPRIGVRSRASTATPASACACEAVGQEHGGDRAQR